jgi:hypothetical protein
MRHLARLFALAVPVALLAAPAGAQYGARQYAYAHDPSLDVPYVAQSVAALAVRFGGDLQLSQHQLDVIQSVRQHQDSVSAPFLRTLDSLRNGPRPVNPLDLSQEQRESIAQQKAATKAALDALHHADTEARAQVMAILTPDQQAKASRLESDARRVARARTERLADEAVYSGGGGSWNRLRSLPEN